MLCVVDVLLAAFLITHRAPTLARARRRAAWRARSRWRSARTTGTSTSAGLCCAVSVIDPTTGAVTAEISMRHGASGLAISPDGASLYATDPTSGTVAIIATATNAVVATVPAGPSPLGVAVSPDGRTAYVAEDTDPGSVAVIDTATASVTRTIPVGGNPSAVGDHARRPRPSTSRTTPPTRTR